MLTHGWATALLLSCSTLLAGCVIPFASPPVQVQGGISLRRLDGTQNKAPRLTFPGQLKVGVHPLQYLRGWTRRTVDFGAGYVGEFDQVQSLHGAYAEVAPTLLRSRKGKIRRLSLRGQARALTAVGYQGWGYGGAIQLSAELGGFVPGTIRYKSGPNGVVGYGWGESTVGLYAEMGYAQIDSLQSFTMTGGIQWRIPASIGAGYLLLGTVSNADPKLDPTPGAGGEPAPEGEPPRGDGDEEEEP